MSTTADMVAEVQTALKRLPTEEGGIAVVLASSGPPPALALLSSGDVFIDGDTVRAVVYRGSAAAERLGGSFALLVPSTERAYRVEVEPATSRLAGNVHLLEGRLREIRPTTEPPWTLKMSFEAGGAEDVSGFLAYWRSVRGWLESGAQGDPPTPAV